MADNMIQTILQILDQPVFLLHHLTQLHSLIRGAHELSFDLVDVSTKLLDEINRVAYSRTSIEAILRDLI